MINHTKTWYSYSKGECYMEIIGKIITFVMSTFSNLVDSSSLIDDIKKGFKEILKKDS